MSTKRASSDKINEHSTRPYKMQFREWAALLLSFCVIGIIGLLALTHVSATLFSHLVSRTSMGETRPQTAAIVLQTDPDHCRQFTFDNDSGQIRGGEGGPCDSEFDPTTSPISKPVGTMRRLDAISKSFLGRQ